MARRVHAGRCGRIRAQELTASRPIQFQSWTLTHASAAPAPTGQPRCQEGDEARQEAADQNPLAVSSAGRARRQRRGAFLGSAVWSPRALASAPAGQLRCAPTMIQMCVFVCVSIVHGCRSVRRLCGRRRQQPAATVCAVMAHRPNTQHCSGWHSHALPIECIQ